MNNNIPATPAYMKNSFLIICTAWFLASGYSANAQQGNLGDEQINVVKPYQPTLSDAFKISDVPGRDTGVVYTPDLDYKITPVQYPTIYTISPIKPVKIKDENIKKLYRGFAKGGYGTKNTPYLEVFYNSLRSKTFDAGVHASHISSTGKIKGFGYPGMSESGIKLFGSRFFDHHILKGEAGYNRSVYHWYGYNSPPDIFSKSDTKHTFDDAFGNFSFGTNHRDVDEFRYKAGIGFHTINDNKGNDEGRLAFTAMAGKKINDMDVSADFEFDALKYDTDLFGSSNHSIVRLNPRVVQQFDRLHLTAGANVSIEMNDLTEYHLHPHARIDYTLVSEMMSIYGQLTGGLERNTFRQFSKENPFLAGYFPLRNTNNKLDLSAGINVKLDRQLAFIGSVGIKRLTDDAFYRNLNSGTTLVTYEVMYDNNTQSNIHAEVVYDQGEKTGFSLGADYFGNTPSREDKPLFRPAFKMTVSGFYTIGEKIFLSTQWGYVSSRNAVDYATGGDYSTLKAFIDGNLHIDYRYTKVMSVFVNLNNVTASKYSRWYNYPSYRFSAMAGLTYSF